MTTTPLPRLDNILPIARLLLVGELPQLERTVIEYLVEILGIDVPCGLPKPVLGAGMVVIDPDCAGRWQPGDAIAFAAELIRAAERACAA